MKAFKQVFQDRAINNLIVAIIIGISTFSFVFSIGQQLLVPMIQSDSPSWVWGLFWSQLIVWVFSVLVAVGISAFAKGK